MVLSSLLVISYVVISREFGGTPTGERLVRVEASPQYNLEAGHFQNKKVVPLESRGRSTWELAIDFFFTQNNRVPAQKLPEAPPPESALDTKSSGIRFIWLGHSSVLLEIDGLRILIDPIFSNNASPVPFTVQRFQPPVIPLEDIRDIDLVVISHDHYDHLDYETVKRLKKREVPFLVPLGVGAHLAEWGIDEAGIIELDWWDEIQIQDVTFTCTPSQHFSGRTRPNSNPTLWSSWAIQGQTENVYFSGDSGYGSHYKEIGDRLGPFDLSFLENGAYSVDWEYVHQMPEQGVQASRDLKSKRMVPIHWGVFSLALHSWQDPVLRVTAAAKEQDVDLMIPKLGELIELDAPTVSNAWWEPLIASEKPVTK